MRDCPCEDVLDSPATVPEKVLDGSKCRARWGTPRGRYDEHSSKFSLSYETKVIEPVGPTKHLQGVVSNLESCTTQLQNFAPTYSEVVILTGFAENKGSNVLCGR